jgi:hypothetical protein
LLLLFIIPIIIAIIGVDILFAFLTTAETTTASPPHPLPLFHPYPILSPVDATSGKSIKGIRLSLEDFIACKSFCLELYLQVRQSLYLPAVVIGMRLKHIYDA